MNIDPEERYQALLARRIPRGQIVIARAYVIHARNGGVGVAVNYNGTLGYKLHREKFGRQFLFVEYDWDEGPPHGTAIPLEEIEDAPPLEDLMLLAWLSEQQAKHQTLLDEAWETVLGSEFFRRIRDRSPKEG